MQYRLRAQLLRLRAWLVIIYTPVLAVLAAVAVASAVIGISVGKFTRDPAALMGTHALVGLISNLGIMLWNLPVLPIFNIHVTRQRTRLSCEFQPIFSPGAGVAI